MEEGRKFDGDKLRWDLLPIECVEDVVRILTFGAKKYAPNNWQNLSEAEDRYYAALLRHLAEWRKGNLIDEESGMSHMAHIMCKVVFLEWLEKNNKLKVQSGKTINNTPDEIPHTT
jgi:hypothetical protein